MISILTPTYNHEKYIGECIQSVLKQTFEEWEMIIVDDGSTDQAASVIAKYKDPRIRYFRQNHIGPWRLAETYNFALSKSSGKYIAILEGDDYWPEDKLRIQFAEMENNPVCVMSYGECSMVTELGREIGYFSIPNKKTFRNNDPVGSSLYPFFELKLFIPALTALIRRSILERIGGFQHSQWVPAVDYPTWLRFCLEGPFLPIENKCLGYWRRHKGSISINYQIEAWEGMAKHNMWFLETYQKQIHGLGFIFDKMTIQEKLNDKLKNIRKNISFEMGLLYLAMGQHKLARRMLLDHLSKKSDFQVRSFVYLGLLSSIVKIDLVHKCRKIRDRIKKWMGKKGIMCNFI